MLPETCSAQETAEADKIRAPCPHMQKVKHCKSNFKIHNDSTQIITEIITKIITQILTTILIQVCTQALNKLSYDKFKKYSKVSMKAKKVFQN